MVTNNQPTAGNNQVQNNDVRLGLADELAVILEFLRVEIQFNSIVFI